MHLNFKRFIFFGWLISSLSSMLTGLLVLTGLGVQLFGLFFVLFLLSALFALAGIVLLGWVRIRATLKDFSPQGLLRTWELWLALFLALVFAGGTLLRVPGFSELSRLPGEFSDVSHTTDPEDLFASIPNLDKQTIWSLAIRFEDTEAKDLFTKLTDRGLVFSDSSQTLAEISKANEISLEGLFNILVQDEKLRDLPSLQKPVGKRTLTEAVNELKLTMDEAVARLSRKGIKADRPTATLDEIARANGIKPIQVYRDLAGWDSSNEGNVNPGGFEPQFLQTMASWNAKNLAEFLSKRQGKEIKPEEIIKRFEKNGVVVKSIETPFGEVAEMNQMPMEKLLRLIGSPRRGAGNSPGNPPQDQPRMDGPNPGGPDGPPDPRREEMRKKAQEALNMTLQEVANLFNTKVEILQGRLKAAGIQASPQQKMADICQRSGQKPRDVFKIMRGNDQ